MTSVTARLEILPFVATFAPGAAFVLVEGQPMMITLPGDVARQLSDPRLGQLFRDCGAGAVVLDVGKIDFAPPDAEWVVRVWPTMLASIGVRKVSLVAGDGAFASLRPLVDHARVTYAPLGIELRAFPAAHRDAATSWLGAPQPQADGGGGGSAELRLPARAHYVATGWGGFVGFLLGIAGATLAVVAAGSRPDATVVVGGLVGSALAAAGVLAVHHLRAVPKGRLTWDARGLAEWVGGEVATFIAWPGARYALLDMSLTTRTRGGQNLGAYRGRTLQISDESGKTITLCDGYRRPPWLENRPSEVAHLEQLIGMVRTPRSPMVVVPDKLGYGRGARLAFGFVAILSYAAFVASAAYLVFNKSASSSDRATSIALLWAGCLLFAIRAIWPLTRVVSKRLRASTLLEVALRGAVFAVFLAISLVLAADIR